MCVDLSPEFMEMVKLFRFIFASSTGLYEKAHTVLVSCSWTFIMEEIEHAKYGLLEHYSVLI
jgi:hypothetical protein